MALRGNFRNLRWRPLKTYEWLYWDVRYLIALYEDIKQDWSATEPGRREELEDGIRYKYGKLSKAIDEEFMSMTVAWSKIPKMKSHLLEMKETANDQLEFMLTADVSAREDLSKTGELYHRMDTVIGAVSNMAERLMREETLGTPASPAKKHRLFKSKK